MTRDIVPKLNFGKSNILCVLYPNESAQFLLQHVDIFEETILKNLLGNFSTADLEDPELKNYVAQYEKVILMGMKPLKRFFKSTAKMADYAFTKQGNVWITPAPTKLVTAQATKFFKEIL